jgi:hypothetical protein
MIAAMDRGEITADVAARLVAGQFPQWAGSDGGTAHARSSISSLPTTPDRPDAEQLAQPHAGLCLRVLRSNSRRSSPVTFGMIEFIPNVAEFLSQADNCAQSRT